jgi:hypothetical protein
VATKTKTRTKAKLLDTPEPAPMIGPQTFDAWVRLTMRAVEQKDASPATRAEFRRLLELRPAASELYGDMPTVYRRIAADRFASFQLHRNRSSIAQRSCALSWLASVPARLNPC